MIKINNVNNIIRQDIVYVLKLINDYDECVTLFNIFNSFMI
jgi:hypothetical protein